MMSCPRARIEPWVPSPALRLPPRPPVAVSFACVLPPQYIAMYCTQYMYTCVYAYFVVCAVDAAYAVDGQRARDP